MPGCCLHHPHGLAPTTKVFALEIRESFLRAWCRKFQPHRTLRCGARSRLIFLSRVHGDCTVLLKTSVSISKCQVVADNEERGEAINVVFGDGHQVLSY